MYLSNSGLKWIIYSLMMLFYSPQRIEAIEISDIQWGFSNRPVAYKINPVTILVENTEPQPFESEIRLQKETFRGQQIDIALSATIYVAPFEKKWLQFYPYLTDTTDNWKVSWKNGNGLQNQSFLSPRPTTKPVTIQLIQPDNLSKAIPGIKQYPEDLFPPVLGAIDSLKGIILDHVPKWEKSRRKTFIQWIYSGGTVHLFENSNGNLPAFPESYSSLNINQATSPVHFGNGIIYIYRNKLNDIPPLELKQLIVNNMKSVKILRSYKSDNNVSHRSSNPSYDTFPENATIHSLITDQEILVTLADMSKTKQIWYFIFSLSFIYLIVAGPGYYLITKFSKKDYTFYVVYIGSTAVFCLFFLIIGHYSANRISQISSLIIADVLPDNEIDITEWSSLGIASGGDFKISHAGDSHIYSTCQQFAKVNGVVTSGSEGKLQVDIPTNSSRSFFHRGKISKNTFSVNVISFLANEMGLETLSLEIDKNFPNQVDQIHFLFGARLYELHKVDNRLEFRGTSRNVSPLLNANPLIDQYYLPSTRVFPFPRPRDQINILPLNHLFPVLLQRALHLSSLDESRHFHLLENRGKLFVLSNMPESLFPETPSITRKQGLVLYCLEVPLTGPAG